MSFQNWHINKSWTLFLDRDGVINKKIDADYVRDIAMFEFLGRSLEAICTLSAIFGRIIILTNQQGIGKKLMSENDLNLIHDYMLREVIKSGGRIDAVYFSPHLKEENNPMRKPGDGMLLLAKQHFPEIDYSKSIMVGDSESDMIMAEKHHIKKILIANEKNLYINCDYCFSNLFDFSEKLKNSFIN